MTRKIDRYEVLGALATGGMAEILLARLVGPSGFERPVVIKRTRPDLDDDDVAELFLEEAKLAAKIRHANVIHVEDLGTDQDGAPYMVMEYLDGENLSNVARRLVSQGGRLPFELSAYILAEACAGLHAAHELRDPDGHPLGLVHRDVSPQNIFVTYQGAVKVVDFGIAKIKSSATTTDAGQVRGKVGYMAPEQLAARGADRRSDIFVLGIVLYESLTAYRLFKRFTQAATSRAILVEPIPAPSRVLPDVPAALEAICLRALARDPSERYATALEMRRELLVAIRELSSEEPGAQLAVLMEERFADRIAEKRALLRRVQEGSVIDHVPEGDVDPTIEIPTLDHYTIDVASDGMEATTREGSPFPGPAAARRAFDEATVRRRRSKGWLPLAMGLFTVILLLGLFGPRIRHLARASASASTERASPSTSVTSAPSIVTVAPSAEAVGPARLPSVSANPRTEPLVRKVRPRQAPSASAPLATPPSDPPPPSSSAHGFHRFQ